MYKNINSCLSKPISSQAMSECIRGEIEVYLNELGTFLFANTCKSYGGIECFSSDFAVG